jgi:hypothetical protein
MLRHVSHWVYDADTHCDGCAIDRFGFAALYTACDSPDDVAGEGPEGVTDSEGNDVSAVHTWEEFPPEGVYCGTCHECIEEPTDAESIEDAIEANLETSEDLGDVDTFGWYGRYDDVTPQELRDIGLYGEAHRVEVSGAKVYSYIIRCDSQGFRHLEDSNVDVSKAWTEIDVEYYSAFLAEAEDSET